MGRQVWPIARLRGNIAADCALAYVVAWISGVLFSRAATKRRMDDFHRINANGLYLAVLSHTPSVRVEMPAGFNALDQSAHEALLCQSMLGRNRCSQR